MNIRKSFAILALFLVSLCANAQTVKPQTIIVIDGYFFNEMPVSKQILGRVDKK